MHGLLPDVRANTLKYLSRVSTIDVSITDKENRRVNNTHTSMSSFDIARKIRCIALAHKLITRTILYNKYKLISYFDIVKV